MKGKGLKINNIEKRKSILDKGQAGEFGVIFANLQQGTRKLLDKYYGNSKINYNPNWEKELKGEIGELIINEIKNKLPLEYQQGIVTYSKVLSMAQEAYDKDKNNILAKNIVECDQELEKTIQNLTKDTLKNNDKVLFAMLFDLVFIIFLFSQFSAVAALGVLPVVILPLVLPAVVVGLTYAYAKYKDNQSFKRFTDENIVDITTSVLEKISSPEKLINSTMEELNKIPLEDRVVLLQDIDRREGAIISAAATQALNAVVGNDDIAAAVVSSTSTVKEVEVTKQKTEDASKIHNPGRVSDKPDGKASLVDTLKKPGLVQELIKFYENGAKTMKTAQSEGRGR